MLPSTVSMSRPSRFLCGLLRRTSALTPIPARKSSRATADPTKPVAPVMKAMSPATLKPFKSIQKIRLPNLVELRLAGTPAHHDLAQRDLRFDLFSQLPRPRENIDRHLVVFIFVRRLAPFEGVRLGAEPFAQQ